MAQYHGPIATSGSVDPAAWTAYCSLCEKYSPRVLLDGRVIESFSYADPEAGRVIVWDPHRGTIELKGLVEIVLDRR